MRPSLIVSTAALVLAVHAAAAEPCVQVRDGTDGTGASNGLVCMVFSPAQRQAAQQLGLDLGSPYARVRAQMARQGWVLEPAWAEEYPAEARQVTPACGRGWDAVCHLGMRKGPRSVELVFSGTHPDNPLVAVRGAP